MPPLVAVAIALTAPFQAGSESPFPLEVRPTQVIRGPADSPARLVRLVARRPLTQASVIRARCGDDAGLSEARLSVAACAAGTMVDLFVPIPGGREPDELWIELTEGAQPAVSARVAAGPPDTDWVMHFIAGFHYDPVWWNTQGHYTETGHRLDATQAAGLTLVHEYLRMCRADGDYRVALHQLPYLKTFLEAFPHEAEELLSRIGSGQVSIVGGTYNELSSTLISAEAAIRNAVYGTLFQREVLGGDGRVFWQCDVFGHDPSFASLMRGTGHSAGAFARGPFHQWGAPREQVNFPSEFLWMSPDGSGVLTHYMTGHYGYAYQQLAAGANRATGDAADWERVLTEMFEDLRRPALTRQVLLPMHSDFVRPMENLGEVVRRWNAKYLSPRAAMSTPESFFAAVRQEIASRDLHVPAVTRDMNPIYTGCAVSFADLKLAQRACETALRDAELFATLAWLEGAAYPQAGLDRAWRQLLFCAHHDGVTGSMSDQVYVDLMYAYRDALELARSMRDRALDYLGRRLSPPADATIFWNSLPQPRDARDGGPAGQTTPAADVVPAVGYRVVPTAARERELTSPRVVERGRTVLLENGRLRAVLDLDRGGCLTSLVDLHGGHELLRGPGNDLVVCREYERLPGHGEGPWHLAPTGERRSGTGAAVRTIRTGPGEVVFEADHAEFSSRQTVRLARDAARLYFRTEILRWRGRDDLLRVEFPLDLPGARPVFQTAAAVIGRPYARDVDTMQDPWTLDQTCWQWVAAGAVCSVEVVEDTRIVHRRALGVGEIVVPAEAARPLLDAANRLAAALVRRGVTTTLTRTDRRRYGDLAYDSNVPDFRILLGLSDADPLMAGVPPAPPATVAYVEADRELPRVALREVAGVADLLRGLAESGRIRVSAGAAAVERRQVTPERGVGLLTRGAVSARLEETGRLALNLLRSCTGWPAGVWIDGPPRRHPDGTALELMHGTHVFDYALVVHEGDFRAAGLSAVAQAYNSPLLERSGTGVAPQPPTDAAEPPPSREFVRVEPAGVLLTAMKAGGFGEARWAVPPGGAPRGPRRAVLRLWNGRGEPCTARVRLDYPVTRAWQANLLEEEAQPLTVAPDGLALELGENEAATLVCELTPASTWTGTILDPTQGDLSPSAYWLENRGEGATGNGLVALALSQRRVDLRDGASQATLRVANNNAAASVELELNADAGDHVTVALSSARLVVPPRRHAEVDVTVKARGGALPAAPSVVTIRARQRDGRSVTASLWVGMPGDHEADAPAVEATTIAPLASAGGRVAVRLRNRTSGPIYGELTWLGPLSTWSALPQWRRSVILRADAEQAVECPVGQGLDAYVIPRFTFAGRVVYGEAVALLSRPDGSVLRVEADRVRVTAGRAGDLRIEALEGGWPEKPAAIAVEASPGWQARETHRAEERGEWGRRTVTRFAVERIDGGVPGASGVLHVRGAGGQERRVAVVTSPVQRAAAGAEQVRVDGSLEEWRGEEFTSAEGKAGRVRGAVRYSAAGLALAFEAADARYVQPFEGAAIWQGDSVQWGLTASPADRSGYAGVYEFGVARPESGALVWCWHGGPSGRTGRVMEAKAAVVHESGRTRYEVFLPRSAAVTLALQPGARLGFAYALLANDGAGLAGHVEWSDGITDGKDASLFGELELTP